MIELDIYFEQIDAGKPTVVDRDLARGDDVKDYNKLAVKHGVYDEYKNACEKEKSGAGNGWRINVEKALDSAERGHDIVGAMEFWCGRRPMPSSHTESGLRYRDI